jgi:hypothetical protein
MGPQGLAGPQGLNGSNGVSGYERSISDSGMFGLGNTLTTQLDAPCPAGKTVVSGGYEMATASAQRLGVTMSAPYEDETSGWRVIFRNGSGVMLSSINVRVHVVCASLQ